jgi:hypothetical protein
MCRRKHVYRVVSAFINHYEDCAPHTSQTLMTLNNELIYYFIFKIHDNCMGDDVSITKIGVSARRTSQTDAEQRLRGHVLTCPHAVSTLLLIIMTSPHSVHALLWCSVSPTPSRPLQLSLQLPSALHLQGLQLPYVFDRVFFILLPRRVVMLQNLRAWSWGREVHRRRTSDFLVRIYSSFSSKFTI